MHSLGREISCFLKTTVKKLGDQYIVGPPDLKVEGHQCPRFLRLLRLWSDYSSSQPIYQLHAVHLMVFGSNETVLITTLVIITAFV